MRTDGRKPQEMRPVRFEPHITRYAEGSVKVEFGHTQVICTASIETEPPKWLSPGKGWVTAEYGMLPRSTHTRMRRDKINTGGRTQEISRLIGRSLRAAVDADRLGGRLITVDCDVVQADGGTRTAAVTGGFLALCFALKFLRDQGQLNAIPIVNYISAVSVGLQGDQAILDLNYDEDSTIQTDMNFVMNQKHEFVEIQGTAESGTFSEKSFLSMMTLAKSGCDHLMKMQKEWVGSFVEI